MSTLHVIRHAQASMFAADYDQLSEHGREQARTLGRVLAERRAAGGPAFDLAFTGPARRHVETAALIGEQLSESDWPQPSVLAGFDEHDGQTMVMAALARITQSPQPDAEDRRLLELAAAAAEHGRDRRERSKLWQLLFEAIMRRWIAGELELDGVESFALFEGRVRAAFAELRERAQGEIVLVSSVGPIAILLATVLELAPARAFEQAWRVYNCSITRIVYSGPRVTLDGFNEVAHLPRADWTHR